MGKKKRLKKRRKMIRRMEKWIDGESWTADEVLAAGLATLAGAAKNKDKKRFTRSVKQGRKLMDHFFGFDDSADAGSRDGASPAEPVISYSPVGGGWYSVAIDGVEVDKLKGETRAAERAGELLEAYASTEPSTTNGGTEVTHSGGGWYDVTVNGVPVGRYRGRDSVPDRFADLVQPSA